MTTPPPPPAIHDLPAGTQLVAGLGVATVLPEIDFETRSAAGFVYDPHLDKWRAPVGTPPSKKPGLALVGAEVYARHPSTRVLCGSYDLKDGRGRRRLPDDMTMPADLRAHVDAGGLIESHNAGFERKVWNHTLAARHGWAPLPIAQQRCSAAKSAAFGLPRALSAVQKVRGGVQKDPEGERLIKKFSVPGRGPQRKGEAWEPFEGPDAEKMREYCDGDIMAEADVSAGVPDLDADEQAWWELDQACNDRGVQIDTVAVEAAIAIVEEVLSSSDAEIRALTGGAVERCSELAKLSAWLAEQGVAMGSMDEDAIDEAVEQLPHGPARRALMLRQGSASASVKKLYQMRNTVTDEGRLHDQFLYYGARTGRDTSGGVQLQNFPNSGPDVWRCMCGRHYGLQRQSCPWCGADDLARDRKVEWGHEAANDAIEVIGYRSAMLLRDVMGDPLSVISACLRGMITAGPGRELIASDFTAIEAVVLATMAGEQWRVSLFEERGKLYEASYSQAFKDVTYEEMLAHKERTGSHHPKRKVGKTLELACGFGSWIGGMVAFGAGEWMTEDEIKTSIVAWRAASPAIVELWGGQYRGLPWADNRRTEYFGLEGAAVQAMLNPGTTFRAQGRTITLGGQTYTPPPVEYLLHGGVLYCTLPSGRRICYQQPSLSRNARDKWGHSYAINFYGWNTNAKKGPFGWIQMQLYGGLLAENITQAIARDIMVNGAKRVDAAGYALVMRVHDELVSEVPEGFGSIEAFETEMSTMPAWAAGWPVRASGTFRARRYRK